MALTVYTNGSASGNIIQAAWWNQYHDLLTGVMTTQPVTIANTVTVSGLLTASAGLTVSGATAFSGSVSIPNATLLSFLATTIPNGSIYIDSSNNMTLHAGNSNKIILTDKTSNPIVTVDATANSVTIPNANTLNFLSTTGTSGSVYTDSSNNMTIHAGNSNKVIITDKGSIPYLTIDGAGVVTLPNSTLLTLAANTGVNATMYCNSSNDFIVHAGNSNKVIITSNGAIAQLTVDAGASLITAVPKIQANGGIAFAGGTGITRFSSAIASNTAGTFNHGLGATPTGVYVTGYGSGPGYYSTDTYTTTQFKVYAAGGTINWQAIALI